MNKIIFNDQELEVEYYDNETMNDLKKHFPLNLEMSELNGNEYYAYLDFSLKGNNEKINQIEKGDIMLYSNKCIVIFYESFKTPYSYIRLGKIKNPDNLEKGINNVNVQFL